MAAYGNAWRTGVERVADFRKDLRRMARWRGTVLTIFLVAVAQAGTIVWQPVTDYSISFPGDRTNNAPAINPFENFTHFGTDFGWMGPGQQRIDARAGAIRTRAEGDWTGTWHSLAGLAAEQGRSFDPYDVTGLGGPQQGRAKVSALTIDVRGTGTLKIELADSSRAVRWTRTLVIQPGDPTRHRFGIAPGELGKLKFFNWISESGSALEVSSLGFEVDLPEISPEEWVFRLSLGKLRRCHDPASGMTRDRAHVPPGTFDSVGSSALHALASAAAAGEGILDRDTAEEEVRMTTRTLLTLSRAAGFLPHFTYRAPDGTIRIHPGTEYSTIDTSIAFHALRLAGDILALEDVKRDIETAIGELKFDLLTDTQGWIGHGFVADGVTPLAGHWRDWGGETALVLALEAMVPNREPKGKMDPSGKVFRGVEFISELQSLFYPDFDREQPDAVTGISWPQARRDLLQRQRSYVREQWPGTPADGVAIFGLSAGESGMPGAGYTANGVDLTGIRWLHPHALIMGSSLSSPADYVADIGRLQSAQILFPMGLPENVEIGLKLHNPMEGSLNAGFEALAAYHGWRRGESDLIYRACLSDPLLRRAIARFYP
jgi:hypothetical protein